MMSFILNWFFDDYGFPSGWWWALMFIIAIIFSVAFNHVYYKIFVVFIIVYAGIFLVKDVFENGSFKENRTAIKTPYTVYGM